MLICVFVIPYLSMDMDAMLADLKKLLKDNEITFDLVNEKVYNLFREYIEQKGGEVKEHMTKQAVQELIVARKLKKGGFEYTDYVGKSTVLSNNAVAPRTLGALQV